MDLNLSAAVKRISHEGGQYATVLIAMSLPERQHSLQALTDNRPQNALDLKLLVRERMQEPMAAGGGHPIYCGPGPSPPPNVRFFFHKSVAVSAPPTPLHHVLPPSAHPVLCPVGGVRAASFARGPFFLQVLENGPRLD